MLLQWATGIVASYSFGLGEEQLQVRCSKPAVLAVFASFCWICWDSIVHLLGSFVGLQRQYGSTTSNRVAVVAHRL